MYVLGHFSQVVWKETKELGVGIAESKCGLYYICCNYYPAGNVEGKYKENVPPRKGSKTQVSSHKEQEKAKNKPKGSENLDTARKSHSRGDGDKAASSASKEKSTPKSRKGNESSKASPQPPSSSSSQTTKKETSVPKAQGGKSKGSEESKKQVQPEKKKQEKSNKSGTKWK